MPKKSYSISLRILGYKSDDGQWTAHCLETDLVGYGATFNKAIEALIELTDMQISFALYKKQPSLLYHPAPLHIIEQYHSTMQSTLQNYTYTKKCKTNKNFKIASMPLPNKNTGANASFVQAQAI